jgi:outer membrane lipoprotein-sorting protein
VLLDTKAVDVATLIQMVGAEQQRVHSMVGEGSVTFDSPEIAGTASFDMAMKRPDSLLVRFEGPFGIDVGTLFLSRNKYLVYNSLENVVYTGTPTSSTLRAVIPFDLTYDEILNAFSGMVSLPKDPAEVSAYTIDEDRFFLSLQCGTNLCDYWIDPEYRLVTRYQVTDTQGHVLLEAQTLGVIEQDSLNVPRRIRVTFPEQGRRISISYSSLTLNGAEPSFSFSVPPNARTIVR